MSTAQRQAWDQACLLSKQTAAECPKSQTRPYTCLTCHHASSLQAPSQVVSHIVQQTQHRNLVSNLGDKSTREEHSCAPCRTEKCTQSDHGTTR